MALSGLDAERALRRHGCEFLLDAGVGAVRVDRQVSRSASTSSGGVREPATEVVPYVVGLLSPLWAFPRVGCPQLHR